MLRVDKMLCHDSNLFKVARDVVATGSSNVDESLHEWDKELFIINSGSLEKGFHNEVTLILHLEVPGHVRSCTRESLSSKPRYLDLLLVEVGKDCKQNTVHLLSWDVHWIQVFNNVS